MSFPHDRGLMPLETYLHRLLCALVIQSGGELRLKASLVMSIEPGQALTRTRDRKRDGGASSPSNPVTQCSTKVSLGNRFSGASRRSLR